MHDIKLEQLAKETKDYELNNLTKYYYIELPKFRNANPDMNINVNQWLALIDMERGDLLDMAKKKNKAIENAFEDYEVLTGDDEIKRVAELRLMSQLEENSAIATARAKGEEIGLEEAKKRIAIKLLNLNMNIEEIEDITELSKNEILELKNNM